MNVLNRLVHERAEHRALHAVFRKAEIAEDHVLRRTPLVGEDVARKGVVLLDARLLDLLEMKVLRDETRIPPVHHILDDLIERLAELTRLALHAREDEQILRTRKRHIVLPPEVKELDSVERLERRTMEILALQRGV